MATNPSPYSGSGGSGFANPMTTAGDLIDATTGGTAQRLAVGSSGNVLTVTTGAPAWGAVSGLSAATTSAKGVIQLDGTAADIQPVGTQAAGSNGLAADSGHVHSGISSNVIGGAVATLSDAATILVNAALGNHFRFTFSTSARTMGAPSNPVDGQRILFELIQGASGGPYTVSWASGSTGYNFGSAGQPTLTTTASARDVVGFVYSGSKTAWLYLGVSLDF